MFFEQWWQALIFGFITTVVMLMLAYVFATKWETYEDKEKRESCEVNHHF